MKAPPTDQHQPLELVISTLLYLMTRHNMNPCPNVRQAIVHHLTMLHNHPNTRNADALENTTRRLANEWLRFTDNPPPFQRQDSHPTLQ